jgi:secreted trypsin-like serine protease
VAKMFLAAVAAATVVCVSAGGAGAITGGTPTGPGQYTNVGALIGVAPSGQKKLFCSGTLIAPTVFLTAAHCIASIQELPGAQVAVTFDQTFTSSSKLIFGTPVISPYYNHTGSDPEDIAVVLLDQPVNLPAAPVVSTVGYLDRLDLKKETFTNVGYGVSEPVNAPKGPVVEGAGTRRFSTSGFNSLTKGFLKLAQTPGGTCTGDSGGPQFSNGLLVAITTTGDTQCKATSVDQRLDTPQAQAFLSQYI